LVKRLTTEEFKKKVYDWVREEYTVLGEYTTARKKILMKHNKCGHIYGVRPDDFRNGKRCPECAKDVRRRKRAKTTEQFKKEVYSLEGANYTVLGEYTNWETKVEIRHNECGYKYKVQPNAFLQGRRCPKCQHKIEVQKRTKSDEQFKKELKEKYKEEYIALETYINNATKIKFRHTVCGYVWRTAPSNLLHGFGCPVCRQSKGERLTAQVLDKLGFKYEREKKFPDLRHKGLLSYDFFIPDNKLLIEYQGVQHYEPIDIYGGEKQLEEQQLHDSMKREYAHNRGYKFIEIPYTEDTFDKVYKYIKNNIS